MNKYLRMLGFVSLLGVVSGGLLFGTGMITNSLIEANADALLKSEVLTGHSVQFTFTNIHDVFAANTTTITEEGVVVSGDENLNYTFTFYQDKTNGYVTFGFGPIFGGGVWGPIIGLLTLEEDFTTIRRIAILQQEETPGLGGIVATRDYLDQFVGKKIGIDEDALEIVKGLDPTTATDNQVAAITGATRTSSSFNGILNKAYTAHYAVWQARG